MRHSRFFLSLSRLSDVNYFRLHFRNESTKILCVEWNEIWHLCCDWMNRWSLARKQYQMCAIVWCCRSDTISPNPMQSFGFERLWNCTKYELLVFQYTQSYTHSAEFRSIPWYCWSCCSNLWMFSKCEKPRRFISLWFLIANFHKSNGWMHACILIFSDFNQAIEKLNFELCCWGLLWCLCNRWYAWELYCMHWYRPNSHTHTNTLIRSHNILINKTAYTKYFVLARVCATHTTRAHFMWVLFSLYKRKFIVTAFLQMRNITRKRKYRHVYRTIQSCAEMNKAHTLAKMNHLRAEKSFNFPICSCNETFPVGSYRCQEMCVRMCV